MRCVPARDFSVGKALAWKGAIYDDPPYQRESFAWSVAKQQRFIDSLLNGFDVPKIYLHDLRGRHPTRVYAIIDGKQRLNAIWRFLEGTLALAHDFEIEPANVPELPTGVDPPRAGAHFADFEPAWQKVLKRTPLSVVLVQEATVEDIEDLFSRLNSGEPLNAAEKRNARGGDMAALVRLVARRPFVVDWLGWTGTRFQHLDLAARLLLVEAAEGGTVPDLGSRALDAFLDSNRRLAGPQRDQLLARVVAGLARLERVFRRADPLLARQPPVTLYYLLVREIFRSDGKALDKLRPFLEAFDAARKAIVDGSNGPRDAELVEFTQLGSQRPNDGGSLARRLDILVDRFGAGAPVGSGRARD